MLQETTVRPSSSCGSPHLHSGCCSRPAGQSVALFQLLAGEEQALLNYGHLPLVTLLSFDLSRNCYIKNVVLFEDNSILLLPGRSEAPGVKSVWGEVSQESPKNR